MQWVATMDTKMKTFFVYMHNNRDPADDEVYKVRANSSELAKEVAREKMDWPGRFSVGWVMPYFPKKKSDKEFLKGFRWWATDKRDE
jgi:hypothetical protein